MPDPSPQELEEIARARGRLFRPAWVLEMIRATRPFGETFWVGHVGIQLVLMPLWLVLVVVLPAALPSAQPDPLAGGARGPVLVFFVLQALWSGLVTQAVLRVAPRAPQAGIWRWIGCGLSLAATIMSVYLLQQWLTGAL